VNFVTQLNEINVLHLEIIFVSLLLAYTYMGYFQEVSKMNA